MISFAARLPVYGLAVPSALRRVRQELDLEQQWVADQLGVTNSAVLRWEKGRENPRTHHVLAYAHLVNRRLMAGRDGRGLYDLETLLRDLAAFRRAHNLTQQNLADRMNIASSGIGKVEHKLASQQPIGWHLTVRYVAGLGYQIGIAKTGRRQNTAPARPGAARFQPSLFEEVA